MVDMIERFVDVPGGYLFCQTRGEGPDVVLINAGAADLRMWDTTVSWLSEIARVTTFDYRDTGLSSAGTEPYREIEDIAAIMDSAGVTSAVLVGVSDGARRAMAFAHQYPGKVSRVVAVGGTFGEFRHPSPEEAAARQRMRKHLVRREQVLASAGVRAAAEMDIEAWAPMLDRDQHRKMVGMVVANSYFFTLEDYLGTELDPPVKERFEEITTPISVLVGGHDFESTRLWARRIVEQAPDASLTILAEADHFPMLSVPEAFERYLRETLG